MAFLIKSFSIAYTDQGNKVTYNNKSRFSFSLFSRWKDEDQVFFIIIHGDEFRCVLAPYSSAKTEASSSTVKVNPL